MDILDNVNLLINYALNYLDLDKDDIIYAYNFIIHKIGISGEYKYRKVHVKQNDLYKIIFTFKQFLNNDTPDDTINEILSFLTPKPSQIINKYHSFNNKEDAFNYFYNLQINNNYIKKEEIAKNIIIKDKKSKYKIIVTINLSKPEKDNKEIAKLINNNQDIIYPKCALCIENVNNFKNKKLDLRIIPLKLNKQDWFLQFSPYSYFYQHCIVIKNNHEPMAVCLDNIKALFDFASQYKFLFIGSNADKPIVGGSILNHEHFQGGNMIMPLMNAKTKREVLINNFNNVKTYLMDWPCTTFKFVSKNKKDIINAIDNFLNYYKSYNNKEINIDCNYSTATIIARYFNDKYEGYFILRNAKTNNEYPNGLFHVRDNLQFIKKEGIGLIEAMGLFILPPRLKRQLKDVDYLLKNYAKKDEIYAKLPYLSEFLPMVNAINNKEVKSINDYLIKACIEILFDIDIFKFANNKDKTIDEFLSLYNKKEG